VDKIKNANRKNIHQNDRGNKNNFFENFTENLNAAQRTAVFFAGLGAIATGAAGSGIANAGKFAVICWLGAAAAAWVSVGRERKDTFFKKSEELATALKKRIDGISAQSSPTPAQIISSNRIAPGLPPFSMLPQPPAWARKASEERTGAGFALRVNRAFRRCGLMKEGDEKIEVLSVQSGPAAARVTISLPDGMRLTRLQHMTGDLASAFGVESLQVIPGTQAGSASLIIAYKNKLPVLLRPVLVSEEYKEQFERAELPIVVGVNDIGEPIIVDLVRVRHLLVAGTTGSGKSWFINEVLVTLLMSKNPDILNFVLIDPKKVELSQYRGLPHTITVATEVQDAVDALKHLVQEMEHRYTIFEKAGVKNIQHYWKKTGDRSIKYIVGVIDELADLMVVARKEVESLLQRLTQLARAAGIHMIVATQRPSVDVITGVIKSNLPSRVVFQLVSGPDYRTVLNVDQDLKLMGRGDGVALLEGHGGLVRFQSPGIGTSDEETDDVVTNLREFWNGMKGEYVQGTSENQNLQEKLSKKSSTDINSKDRNKAPDIQVLLGTQLPTEAAALRVTTGLRAVPGPDMVELPELPDLPERDETMVMDEEDEFINNSDEIINLNEQEDLERLKILLVETWLEAVENGIPIDECWAPSIRAMRQTLQIKQNRLIELIGTLVEEGWLEPPSVPRKPYRIKLKEEQLKKYLSL